METYPTDRASLERACEVAFFIAGGPGGQHRNKVATGVRLRHRQGGIIVVATERRSQHANREMAFARMAERLRTIQSRRAPRLPTRPGRASREHRLQAKHRVSLIKEQRTVSFHTER